MSLLHSFFADYPFDHDDREPVFFFTIPGFEGRFGVVPFALMFWLKTFVLLTIQSLMNAIIAILIYQYIVLPNKRQGTAKGRSTQKISTDGGSKFFKYSASTHVLLLGYGVICPILLLGPLYVFTKVIHFSNVTLMLCCGGTFTILTFRIMETMHGMLPAFALASPKNFVIYYGATLQVQFDVATQQPVPLTRDIFWSKFTRFVSALLQTSLLYSLLLPFDYKVAPQREEIHSLADLYYWGNLVNAYLMASLTSLVLDGGASGLGLLQSLLSGYAMESFSDSPLTKSTSPSDFWGRRWDRPVQSALSRGVFRPLRQAGYSRNVAAFGTFLVSGILHEYVLYFMSLRQPGPLHQIVNNPLEQPPLYGKHLLFFLWNAIVLLLERVIFRMPKGHFLVVMIRWMQTNLPQPVRTLLVLLLVLPIAHFFTDEYIKNSFFDDAAFGFPRIVFIGK